MATPSVVDGVTPPSALPAGKKNVPVSPLQIMKRRLMLIGGACYAVYVLWCFLLLALLPAVGLETLVPFGVLSSLLGGIAFVALGFIGFLRAAQPTLAKPLRIRGLIVTAGIVIPGLILSIIVPFIIMKSPPLLLTIIRPVNPVDLVAPVSMTFSAADAVARLKQAEFFPVQYKWDINSDGKSDQDSTTPELTALFDRSGVFTVTVAMFNTSKAVRTASIQFLIQQSVFSVLPNPVIVNKPAVLSIANLIKDPQSLSEVQWDFDNDGKTDETTKDTQVTYTFFKLGRNTVSVVIILQNNTQARYERSFDVEEAPVLAFPVTLVSQPQYLISAPPFPTLWKIATKEPVAQVLWNFGDGVKGDGVQVAHTFEQRGNYVVEAKVFSKTGSSATVSAIVQVVDQLQLSDLTFEGTPDVQGNRITGEVPLTLNLRPRTSTPFVQFFWEAPDATEVGSTDTSLQAIYRREGTYTVTLVAHDAENHVLRQPIIVEVKPAASSLSIQMNPETGVAPLAVSFDASETFIPGETITGFEWQFDQQSQPSVGGARAQHTYDKAGTYTVNLSVRTTSGKQYQTSRTIAVRPSQLTACLFPSRTSGSAPLGVQFTSSCSTGTITARLWDFGDGAQSDEVEPIHVFDKPGQYTVTLTVTGGDGRKAEQSVTITVSPS